jgi:hypothetical protein
VSYKYDACFLSSSQLKRIYFVPMKIGVLFGYGPFIPKMSTDRVPGLGFTKNILEIVLSPSSVLPSTEKCPI